MSDPTNVNPQEPRPDEPQPAAPPAAPAHPSSDTPSDWFVHSEPEPDAAEGEAIAWTADPQLHLADVEAHLHEPAMSSGPLPVCEYTGEDGEPCEEPAVRQRWSSATLVVSTMVGAIVGGLLVAVAVVWALGYLPGTRPFSLGSEQAAESDAPQKVTISAGSTMAEVSEAVAAKVIPSVVNVTITQEAFDPFSGQRLRRDVGNGSGVIIRPDGHILTNYHVIEGADRLTATVGVTDLTATVVAVDPSSDLAVIKVEDGNYPVIEMGSSAGLRVGEYVMAVGSPFGLEKTVTVGIVSALNRSELVNGETDLTTYTNLIQTDAAINPGNSGGALVDAQGKLVGINTLIQSTSGSSAGVGFAIPVDFALDIAGQLIENGRAVHPYMGVSTESVDQSLASQFSLPVESGALVRFVQPGSPSEAAGIQRGDIVVRIGDSKVESVEDVFTAVREHRVGDTIPVEVVRSDTRRILEVTLGSDADRP